MAFQERRILGRTGLRVGPLGVASPLSATDCYRFVLTNPGVDVCMCGPKDQAQMREALGTLDLGPLSPGELERMRRIGDYLHERSAKLL